MPRTVERELSKSPLDYSYDVEETKHDRQVFVEIDRKQLFATPSAKKGDDRYNYEAGEDTHEKVNMFLDKDSEKGDS